MNPNEGKLGVIFAELMKSRTEPKHPYTSLTRRGAYLYDVSFREIPVEKPIDITPPAGCSTYVQDGKMYRNLDWDYTDLATFHVYCPTFEGMAFLPGLTNTNLDDRLISQLPYHVVDGKNENNIMVSEHVLFNDWDWHGTLGGISLNKVPYLVLSRVKSMETIEDDLADILPDLCTSQTLEASGYLLQFLVTDGVTTCAILPPESSTGSYQIIDISENPKLANFRWVADATVDRADLQDRPTGVERWNMMPCTLSDLRFTSAYESPTRLSEFIGLRGTDKESTDEDLTGIYDTAHELYEERTRDGTTWQTMHSVVYSAHGVDHLWVQEDWGKDYAVPHALADLTDDSEHRTVSDAEKTAWNNKQGKLLYIITEDIVTVTTDSTKGVSPYSTSYGYTNITVDANAGIEWVEGAVYSFVVNTSMVVGSNFRNVRVRIGESGAWKPVYFAGAIAAGNTYMTKNYSPLMVYKTTHYASGCLAILSDNNNTYTIPTLNYTIDNAPMKAGIGQYAITRYSLILQKPDMTWEKVTDTTATYSTAGKAVNTRGFIPGRIRYFAATDNYANGANIAAGKVRNKSDTMDSSYSFNCGTTPAWTVGTWVYLVGAIGEDGLFYLDAEQWWATVLPTEADGKLYIRLGTVITANKPNIAFLEERPIYYNDGTGIREYGLADNKQDVIPDIDDIRSGAAAGATAIQPGAQVITDLQSDVAAIEGKIPVQATDDNQLADKAFVTSAVGTSTAKYISDDGHPFASLAALEAYIGDVGNNDYAYVTGEDAGGNVTYTRYKFNATAEAWAEEFVLNNSLVADIPLSVIDGKICITYETED